NIRPTVLCMLIGCFHFLAYSLIALHILVPSSSRNSIAGDRALVTGARISTHRSSANKCPECAPKQLTTS
ncbi:unnamed protein product, partial [Rotaria sp. Silwood2]